MRLYKNAVILTLICVLLFPMYAFAKNQTNATPEYEMYWGDEEIITFSNGVEKKIDENYKALFINGTLVDADTLTINNRTLVPIRVISETFNGKVDWDGKIKQISISIENQKIEMTIDKKEVYVNNKMSILDVAPTISNGITYVPIRFISEVFNAEVSYHGDELDEISIMFGVPNIYVDQKISNQEVISKEQALKSLKESLSLLYQDFLVYTKEDGDSFYYEGNSMSQIKKDIEQMTFLGEVSRYYIIQGPKRFIVDKYNGNVYYDAGVSIISKMKKYNHSEDEFHIFMVGYFAN